MAELCKQFEVHVSQVTQWKQQLLERAADVFSGGSQPEPVDLAPLYVKIGQMALENDFLKARSPRRDCSAKEDDQP